LPEMYGATLENCFVFSFHVICHNWFVIKEVLSISSIRTVSQLMESAASYLLFFLKKKIKATLFRWELFIAFIWKSHSATLLDRTFNEKQFLIKGAAPKKHCTIRELVSFWWHLKRWSKCHQSSKISIPIFCILEEMEKVSGKRKYVTPLECSYAWGRGHLSSFWCTPE